MKTTCPKCGALEEKLMVKYSTGAALVSMDKDDLKSREHLDRKCGRCGYSWEDECLDHK